VPPRWPLFWNGDETLLATFALSLYTFILLAHWIPLLFYGVYGLYGTSEGKARQD
jgi:hypothetical protein